MTWYEFRSRFLENGGDGVYGACKPAYLEPMFQNMDLTRREQFIFDKNLAMYKPGLCPVAEHIQPQLFQLKTNYWNIERTYDQADSLKQTLDDFQ